MFSCGIRAGTSASASHPHPAVLPILLERILSCDKNNTLMWQSVHHQYMRNISLVIEWWNATAIPSDSFMGLLSFQIWMGVWGRTSHCSGYFLWKGITDLFDVRNLGDFFLTCSLVMSFPNFIAIFISLSLFFCRLTLNGLLYLSSLKGLCMIPSNHTHTKWLSFVLHLWYYGPCRLHNNFL